MFKNAIKFQREVKELQINPKYIVLLATVVLGKAKSLEVANPPVEVANVKALGVASGVILKTSFCPSVGVPLGALIVRALARAVIVYWSVVSLFIVKDVVVAVVTILGVTRLFVRVSVLEIVGTVTPSTEITPALTLAMVVSALPKSKLRAENACEILPAN